MESNMNIFKILSTAAALAAVVAIAAPDPSFARPGGKGGGVRAAGGARAGGFRAGGAGFRGGAPAARFSGRGGEGFRGGNRGGGGFFPGAVAGAVIGGAIATGGYGYYGGPGYAPGYYDDQQYDDAAMAQAPAGDDAVAYCMQTYRSYDPQSGTYLGNDGMRHPCP